MTAGTVVKERDVEAVRTEVFADFFVERFAVQLNDKLRRRAQLAEDARKNVGKRRDFKEANAN